MPGPVVELHDWGAFRELSTLSCNEKIDLKKK